MIKNLIEYLNEVYTRSKKYAFKDTTPDTSVDTDRSIEIENGDCIHHEGYLQSNRTATNRIQTAKLSFVVLAIWQMLCRVQTLYLLIVIIVCAFLGEENLPTAYTKSNLITVLALPLIIELIVLCVREVFYFQRMRRFDAAQNDANYCSKLIRIKKTDFSKATSVDVLQKTAWGALEIGDIIFLSKDEYCPADILILDMWDSKCTASTGFIDDLTSTSLKRAPLLTSISKSSSIKGNLSEYRRVLSGRIDLKRTRSIRDFRGFVNLKKDPISERFGYANILQKYTQLQFTDWLVGIVILCGDDSYSSQQRFISAKERQRRGVTYSKARWDMQSLVSILMICFFSVLVIILRISLTCFKSLPFKGQMVPIAIDLVITFPSYCLVLNMIGIAIHSIYITRQMEAQQKSGAQNVDRNAFGFNFIRPIGEVAFTTHVVFNSLRIAKKASSHSMVSSFCLPNRFFAATTIADTKHQTLNINNSNTVVASVSEMKVEDSRELVTAAIKSSVEAKKIGKTQSMLIDNHNSHSHNFDSGHKINRSVNSEELNKQHHKQIMDISSFRGDESNEIILKQSQLEKSTPVLNLPLSKINEIDSRTYIGSWTGGGATASPAGEEWLMESDQTIQKQKSKESMRDYSNQNSHRLFVADSSTSILPAAVTRNPRPGNGQLQSQTMSSIMRNVKGHMMRPSVNVSIKKLDQQQNSSNNNLLVTQHNSSFNLNSGTPISRGIDEEVGASMMNTSNRSFVKVDQSMSLLLKRQESTMKEMETIMTQHQHHLDDGTISFMRDNSLWRGKGGEAYEEVVGGDDDHDDQNVYKIAYAAGDASFSQELPRFYNGEEQQPIERTRSKSVDDVSSIRQKKGSQKVLMNSLGSAQKIEEKIIHDDNEDGNWRLIQHQWSASDDSDENSSRSSSDNSDGHANSTHSEGQQDNHVQQQQQHQPYLSQQAGRVAKPSRFLSDDVSSGEVYSKKKSLDSLQEVAVRQVGVVRHNSHRNSTNIHSGGHQSDDDSSQQIPIDTKQVAINVELADNQSIPEPLSPPQLMQSKSAAMLARPKVQRLFKKKSFSIVEITNSHLIKDVIAEESRMGGSQDISNAQSQSQSITLHIENSIDAGNMRKSNISNSNNNTNNNESNSNNNISNSITNPLIPQLNSTAYANTWMTRTKQESVVSNSEDQFSNSDSFNKRISISSFQPHGSPNQYHAAIQRTQNQQSNIRQQTILETQIALKKILTEMSPGTYDLLFAMTLCHETKTKGNRDVKEQELQHVHLEEDTAGILEFARSECNFTFECACSISEQQSYLITTPNGETEQVQILNRFSYQSASKTIVICSSNKRSDKFLIIREQASILPQYLSSIVTNEQKQNYATVFTQQKQRGERTVFFTQKNLDEDEYNAFQNEVRTEPTTNQFEIIYNEILNVSHQPQQAQSIKLLGFLGMRDPHNKEVYNAIRDLRTMGKKIWVLTSDEIDRTIESCYNYSILDRSDAGGIASGAASTAAGISNNNNAPQMTSTNGNPSIVDLSNTTADEIFYKIRVQLSEMRRVWQGEATQMQSQTKSINNPLPDGQSQLQQPLGSPATTGMKTLGRPSKIFDEHSPMPYMKSAFALQIGGQSPNTTKSFRQLPSKQQIYSQFPTLQQQPTLQEREKSMQNLFPSSTTPPVTQSSTSSAPPVFKYQLTSTELAEYKNQLNFSVIVCGESMNILRGDEYLWDHFCLLLFYSNTVVGVSLTEEQKSFLGKTLVEKFSEFHPRILHVASSLTDIQRMNFPSASIYFPTTSTHNNNNSNSSSYLPDSLVSQHCDLIGASAYSLIEVIFRESRFISEVFQENIYLAVQRSFLLAETIIYWNILTCACNAPLVTPNQAIFLHCVQYLSSMLFILKRKRRKYNSEKARCTTNPIYIDKTKLASACLPQSTPIFNLKSILSSFIDSAVIYLFYSSTQNQDQPNLDIHLLAFRIRWGIHLISFSRVFDFHHIKFDRYLAIYLITFFVIMNIDAYTSIGNDISQIQYDLYVNFYITNTLLFMAFVTAKCTLEWLFLEVAPVSLIGITKYIKNHMNKQHSSTKRSSQNSLPAARASVCTVVLAPIYSILGWNPPKQSQMTQVAAVIRQLFREREMDIILSQMLMQDEINFSTTAQMKRFFLSFQANEIERAFVKVWERLIMQSDRIFNIVHFVSLDIAYEIIMLSKVTNEFSSSEYLASYTITSSTIFVLIALSLSKYYANPNIRKIALLIVTVRSLKSILLSSFKQIVSYPIDFIIQVAIASAYLRVSHVHLLVQAIILFITLLILGETSIKEWNLPYFLEAIFYISEDGKGSDQSQFFVRSTFYISYWIIVSILIMQKYYMSFTLRTTYLSEQNLYKATIKVKDILSILLPKFIREKLETMKHGSYRVAEKQDEVVIVFCDIYNFDEIIFKEKTNSVRILDKLYREFDQSCQQNGLQKIETVGKTYLAAAGISDVEKLLRAEGRFQNVTPSKRALKFALDLMKITKSNRFHIGSNKRIIIKIGIHLGPAISGVIGYHKPQFSLIGDTVNTTSRVCSTGVADCVTISRDVFNKVQFSSPATLKFIQRDVEAKGKGIMVTYQVVIKSELHLRQFQYSKKKKHTLSFLDNSDRHSGAKPASQSQTEVFKQQMLEFKSYLSNHSHFNQSSSLAAISSSSSSQPDLPNSLSSVALHHSSVKLPPTVLTKKPNKIMNQQPPLQTIPERLKSELTAQQLIPASAHLITSAQSPLSSNEIQQTSSFSQHQLQQQQQQVHSYQIIHHADSKEQQQQQLGLLSSSNNPLINSDGQSIQKARRFIRKSFDSTRTASRFASDHVNEVSSPIKVKKLSAYLTSITNNEDVNGPPPIVSPSISRITRANRKVSSMTIVGLKPRPPHHMHHTPIKEEESPLNLNHIGQHDHLHLNMHEASPVSPLAPTNDFFRKMEDLFMARIDVEPNTITLKEPHIPIEKVILAQQNDFTDATVLGSSTSSYLKLGICSTKKRKSTAEQDHLHLEFIKQTAKLSHKPIQVSFVCVSVYFAIKLILIMVFAVESNTDSSSNPTTMTVYSVATILLLLPIGLAQRQISQKLSWRNQRILIGIAYLLVQFIVVGSTMFFYNFMIEVIQNNKSHAVEANLGQTTISSVVSVITPDQIIVGLEVSFVFMLFTSFKCIDFFEKIGAFVIEILFYLTYANRFSSFSLEVFFFLVLVGIVHLRVQYTITSNEVRSFNNMRTLEAKKDELDQLLENLLPSHILDSFLNSMKKEIPLVCEEHDNVTLLFADIAGFTKYSSTTDPSVVVNMLRKLFTEFDDRCFQQNVYKLYTIGDCYVCFGLIDVTKRNPAQEAHNVARFAFDMIRIIEEVKLFSNSELEMRIGIHTGKIYGGIVGTEIVRYDVYGLDVIIANKMESNGMNGRVTVSEATKQLLEENFPADFTFDFKEAVHIKQTESEVNAYLLSQNIIDSLYE